MYIREYNSYMGGADQLDSYSNNLRPCIGTKKLYWAQLINTVRVLQITAYHFYCHLHLEKRVSQLGFLRNIVHQYVRTYRTAVRKNVYIPNLVSTNTSGNFFEEHSQGRCKYCQKNCCMISTTCNVRLHVHI